MAAGTRLFSPETLAQALIENDSIWQMRLLNPGQFSTFCRDRGHGLLASNIERLWKMGLMRADLIRSGRTHFDLATQNFALRSSLSVIKGT